MKNKLQQLVRFLTEDIWRIRGKDLPLRRFLPLRYLRIFILSIRDFRTNHCALRASALTLYTILAIVPVVAMTFGVAKGFGFEEKMATQIREGLSDRPEVAEWILEFSSNALEGAKGGVMAGVGVAILLWTVIKVLGNIERNNVIKKMVRFVVEQDEASSAAAPTVEPDAP